LKNKLLADAEICFRLMQTMARAIFSLTRELERASFETVHTRLARLLLRRDSQRSSPLGMLSGSGRTSHEELAVQIGVSRETVSRVLSEFKKKNLIETGYRKIEVLNRDGLMEFVEDYDQW
jgi:CRP/FNR family transcriptional regulator